MGEVHEVPIPYLILIVGVAIMLAEFMKTALTRVGIPVLLGYMAIGFFLQYTNGRAHWMPPQGEELFEFLAELGVICLLFRVGLESDLPALIRELRPATMIWMGNVGVSGALGFATAYWVLHVELIPSLFIGVALTATSVGVAIAIWQDNGALRTRQGELLIDVAELDDISAVILVSVLMAVVPLLHEGNDGALTGALIRTGLKAFLSGGIFTVFCLIFSRYVEPHITGLFHRTPGSPTLLVLVVGTGFILASIAGLMGFSVAIGAFFAGLVFSRDPAHMQIDKSFDGLYELFVPFFFVSIGLKMEASALLGGLGLGGALLAVGVLGKIIGTAVPAAGTVGLAGAAVLGVSMVPRAEIAMLIAGQGHAMGSWAVPGEVFSALAVVSAGTCLGSPFIVRSLLRRFPPEPDGEPA